MSQQGIDLRDPQVTLLAWGPLFLHTPTLLFSPNYLHNGRKRLIWGRKGLKIKSLVFFITVKRDMSFRLILFCFVLFCLAKLESQLSQLYSISWRQTKIRSWYRRCSGVKSQSTFLTSNLHLQSGSLESNSKKFNQHLLSCC